MLPKQKYNRKYAHIHFLLCKEAMYQYNAGHADKNLHKNTTYLRVMGMQATHYQP